MSPFENGRRQHSMQQDDNMTQLNAVTLLLLYLVTRMIAQSSSICDSDLWPAFAITLPRRQRLDQKCVQSTGTPPAVMSTAPSAPRCLRPEGETCTTGNSVDRPTLVRQAERSNINVGAPMS